MNENEIVESLNRLITAGLVEIAFIDENGVEHFQITSRGQFLAKANSN